MASEPDIGGRAEEVLREYFLATGYFVVRGLKLAYGGADVTDLDLWLYLRPSPLARERVNVDAKYKQTPKALERVMWAKGVQTILGLERCIVATTDKRPLVKEFGERHGVLVLDGHFLARLHGKKSVGEERLTEEAFWQVIGSKSNSEIAGWKRLLAEARSRFLTHLNFDGCNLWLDDAGVFLNATVSSHNSPVACRLLYVVLSYFLLGIDYSTRHVVFEENGVRKTAIEGGLRYGTSGKAHIENQLNLAADLIEEFSPESKALGGLVRRRALAEIDSLKVGPIADFFSKTDVLGEVFALARELEAAAFRPKLPDVSELSAKAQACIGVLLDLHEIDRTRFYERSRAAASAQLRLPALSR